MYNLIFATLKIIYRRFLKYFFYLQEHYLFNSRGEDQVRIEVAEIVQICC